MYVHIQIYKTEKKQDIYFHMSALAIGPLQNISETHIFSVIMSNIPVHYTFWVKKQKSIYYNSIA